MPKWIRDDAGDIINLDHIICVGIFPIEDQDAAHTHELLAVTPDEYSYRLSHGTLDEMKRAREIVLRDIKDAT